MVPQTPAPHITPETGSSFTLTRTFSASASASAPASTVDNTGFHPASCSVNVGFGGYTVSIHAQPYNFRLGAYYDSLNQLHPNGVGIDNTNGQLHFHYIWSSTSGNIGDLGSCVVYERVSYTGNTSGSYYTDQSGVATYAPPNPPFNWTTETSYDQPDPTNPSVRIPGTQGFADDYQLHSNFSSPYTTASYSSTQNWLFNDSMTGENAVNLLGPLTITRSVVEDYYSPAQPWSYTVTLNGYTAHYVLP